MREPRTGERTTDSRKRSVRERLDVLASLRVRTWAKAFAISTGAAFIIGLPTRLIPNPFFVRMIPTTPADYVFYGIAIALIGLTWALPIRVPAARAESSSLVGGIGTFFAVGCPTCNQLVLALLGSGGALTYFAPLQPVIGVAAILFLGGALWNRLSQYLFVRDEVASERVSQSTYDA